MKDNGSGPITRKYSNSTTSHQVVGNSVDLLFNGTCEECADYLHNYLCKFECIENTPYGVLEIVAPGETVSRKYAPTMSPEMIDYICGDIFDLSRHPNRKIKEQRDNK